MDPFGIPLLNTFILLTSGASVTWAHYAILLADRKQAAMGLWITILLAAIFTVPRLLCQCRVHNQRPVCVFICLPDFMASYLNFLAFAYIG
jgi:hypothetical protein